MEKIKLYNFLTRKKEVFKPIKKGTVGLYTCGPTVYNYAHIGNLRTYIFEDVLKRTLESAGYKVKHVMNITDVDDKIIKNAVAKNKPIREFVKPYEKAFFEDLAKLNIKPAWKYSRATAHIKEMIDLINTLLKKKIAYKTEDGVYFDISKFKNYGRLSQLKKREIKTGARVAADEYEKGSANDFVLWKSAKQREPSWSAPFGPGRPGWHIECSTMSMKYLGNTLDIHGGGVDLLFPHHENEIAQSESATGKHFVKYFMEGEHLLVNGQKMSKSLGNIYALSEIAGRANPLAFRYLVLGAHYRSKLNFTWESLAATERSLERIYEFVRAIRQRSADENSRRGRADANINKLKIESVKGIRNFQTHCAAFKEAIFNDLDTPKALAVLWGVIRDYNKNPQAYEAKYVLETLYGFDEVFGLGLKDLKLRKEPPAEILKLVKEREEARNSKDFTLADEMRRKIQNLGWQVNDAPGGSQVFHS